MAKCRACGAEVIWVLTGSGKRMPCDAAPRPDGNIEIVGEQAVEDASGEWATVPLVRFLKKGEDMTLLEPPPRYVSHFATCPEAKQFRRR